VSNKELNNKKLERIWLSSPHMGGAEINFVQEAFDSNWIAPLGPNVDGFEGGFGFLSRIKTS
jgi:dTDP-4-amino-4,6-dideoxygalactose transaminase